MTIIHLDQYRIEAEKLKMIEKILQMSPKCYLEVVIFKRFILIERLFILYLNTCEKQKFVLDEIWIRDSSYSELVIVAFASHCHYFWNHPHCQCLHPYGNICEELPRRQALLSHSTAKRGFQSLPTAIVTFSSAGCHSICKSHIHSWIKLGASHK